QALSAAGQLELGEGQPGAWPVDLKQFRFAGPLGENAVVGQKHSRVGRFLAMPQEILELRRLARNVIDDKVGHHIHAFAERTHVFPRAQSRIDLSVIDRIESGVTSVYRSKEWQQVDPTEKAAELIPE